VGEIVGDVAKKRALQPAAAAGAKVQRARKGAGSKQASQLSKVGHKAFDPSEFLTRPGLGKSIVKKAKGECVFSQGDVADAVFYIRQGSVKLSVVSKQGKEAVIALLAAGEFLGESCVVSGQPRCLTMATALTDCVLLKISRKAMLHALRHEPALSDVFVLFLLTRNARIQEDLVDQLFNSSEKRLARVLLLLAQFGKQGKPQAVIPKLSQETLAEMVGTTRSRISFFMNRFRKLGFVEYGQEMRIHSSLLNVVLHD
jgi:CRP-like cAMP-binding protein